MILLPVGGLLHPVPMADRDTSTVSYPERIIPDETEAGVVAAHLTRYAFAAPLVAGRLTLDAACGVGYGSAHLAAHAAHVVGLDADEASIAYARKRYGASGVEFRVGDVRRLEDADSRYEAIVSFETIEHVDDPERTLAEFARVLEPDGVFVVSTPRAEHTTDKPENPFHRFEWSVPDFERLLGSRFQDVQLYGQRRLQTRAHRIAQAVDVLGLRRRFAFLRRGSRLLGTPAIEEMTLDDLVIERDALDKATEIVAVCRRPRA